MDQWSPEEYVYWSSRTVFSGDFRVCDPSDDGRWLCLDSELQLIDRKGQLAKSFMPVLQTIGPSPYRPMSLSDRFWRVSEAASRLGLEASWDDTPWGFAGTYYTDALHYLDAYVSHELERDALRVELDRLIHDGTSDIEMNARAVLDHLIASDNARRSAMACLASLQGSLDAAFFEFCDVLQLPTALADHIARSSFETKWELLAAEARVPVPARDGSFADCKVMLQRRNEFIHTPPRLKRKTTPNTWFDDLVPTGPQLRQWAKAVLDHVDAYADALGCVIDFPVMPE